MAGQWQADPMGRAQYRYFDGVNWTHAVATNGVQSSESPDMPLPPAAGQAAVASVGQPMQPAAYGYPTGYAAPASASGGKLMTAGILTIVSGAISLIAALFGLIGAKSFQDSVFGQADSAVNGGSVSTALYLTVLAIAATGGGFLWAGIGAVKKRQWGQIAVIVISAIGVLLYLVLLIASGEAIVLVSVIWFAIPLGLAIAEDKSVFERYSNRASV